MPGDFISTEPPRGGVQRLLARFGGHAYDLHRHETYAVGATLTGAQGFRYRGAGRVSARGQCMVLHPDEWHDGRAAAPDGFLYRMVYLDPDRVLAALGGHGPLPFVGDAVAEDAGLAALIDELFTSFPGPADPLALDGFLADCAGILARRAGLATGERAQPVARMRRVKALIDAEFDRTITSEDLEREAGLDRFETARRFRAFAGTSPHRYLVGRRLAAAHQRIARGEALAEVAAGTGFADQSHLTRAFKARYGLTPGRFRALLAAADSRS